MFETELTAAQQQEIMRCTGWSMAVVGCIRSMDEARIYMNAGLVEARIGGRPALIRRDPDIEYAATAYSYPQKCPKCGSMHTWPQGILGRFDPQRLLYKKIWEKIDRA